MTISRYTRRYTGYTAQIWSGTRGVHGFSKTPSQKVHAEVHGVHGYLHAQPPFKRGA